MKKAAYTSAFVAVLVAGAAQAAVPKNVQGVARSAAVKLVKADMACVDKARRIAATAKPVAAKNGAKGVQLSTIVIESVEDAARFAGIRCMNNAIATAAVNGGAVTKPVLFGKAAGMAGAGAAAAGAAAAGAAGAAAAGAAGLAGLGGIGLGGLALGGLALAGVAAAIDDDDS